MWSIFLKSVDHVLRSLGSVVLDLCSQCFKLLQKQELRRLCCLVSNVTYTSVVFLCSYSLLGSHQFRRILAGQSGTTRRKVSGGPSKSGRPTSMRRRLHKDGGSFLVPVGRTSASLWDKCSQQDRSRSTSRVRIARNRIMSSSSAYGMYAMTSAKSPCMV